MGALAKPVPSFDPMKMGLISAVYYVIYAVKRCQAVLVFISPKQKGAGNFLLH